MENQYMRFTIDDKLGNKELALKNLINCEGQFDNCLKYIIDNNLYSHALKLLNQNQNEWVIIFRE